MSTAKVVSGFFNINKPKGLTSHDVVARVRRLVGQRKVGHAGTLDPLATGLLLVCLGQATRLIEYLVVGQKQYRATIRFGATTDTLDAEGAITSQHDTSGLEASALKQILPRFVGQLQQIPPVFSAIKQHGQPVYKRARAGEAVELSPRSVTIHGLTWQAWSPPDLTIHVSCSAGTYIRALARDIGEAAGTGAYLADLTRTASGQFELAEAVSLEQLEQNWPIYLQPLNQAVKHLPCVILDAEEVANIQQGRKISFDNSRVEARLSNDISPQSPLCAYDHEGDLLAVLTETAPDENIWHPKKVFKI